MQGWLRVGPRILEYGHPWSSYSAPLRGCGDRVDQGAIVSNHLKAT